jgi:hypothetical protein
MKQDMYVSDSSLGKYCVSGTMGTCARADSCVWATLRGRIGDLPGRLAYAAVTKLGGGHYSACFICHALYERGLITVINDEVYEVSP